MTATETATPAWLAEAEAEYEKRRMEKEGAEILQARQNAALVNQRLANLGIVPEEPAGVDHNGRLRAARLLSADFEAETYEVRATWDAGDNAVALHTADSDDVRYRFGRVGLLRSVADVVEARKMAPRFPEPGTNFQARAEASLKALRADYTGGDAHAIAEAINGLTAAVLHMASQQRTS